MKILFIATFPARHFRLYGEQFLKDAEVRMEVSIDHLKSIGEIFTANFECIECIDYHKNLYGRSNFVERVCVPDETHLDIAGDVSKQIIRWSYKGMMQLNYLNNKKDDYDYIIYIDADTKFKKRLSIQDLILLLPNKTEVLSAVFRHDIDKYTETGWIAWNTRNENYLDWVNAYSFGWNTHVYEQLGEYHDCAIFDWACENINYAKYKNLSGGGDHGFNSGILGEFIDHKKGIRKHFGFSFENISGLDSRFGKYLYKIFFGIYIKLKKLRK